MYETFFGIERAPFGTTPDPSFLYLTANHREALAAISYAVLTHRGFVVISGAAGTGKTTLLSRVLETVPSQRATLAILRNSAETPADLLEQVLIEFGVADRPVSRALRLQALQQFFLSEDRKGRVCVLFIDEAQTLPYEVLEEVRLLSNCELPDRKLVQIVLSGQPELESTLERPNLCQLKQRIAVRLRLNPLQPGEVGQYIRFRWAKAGGGEPPFGAAALDAIVTHANGIPRMVNILADNALLQAYCDGAKAVSGQHVLQAAKDLAFAPAATTNGAALHQIAGPLPAVARDDAGGSVVKPLHATVAEPMPTLQRYAAARKSAFSRWSQKFRLATPADRLA